MFLLNKLPLLRLFFLLMLLFQLYCPLNAQDSLQDYENGMVKATEEYQAGKLDEARSTLTGLIKIADRFPTSESKGALTRSFLAIVEADRGRHDSAEQLHLDAINLARIAQGGDKETTGSVELSLCLLRQGEYLLARGKRPAAERTLLEVLKTEESRPQQNISFLARTRWALADNYFQNKEWEKAGRMAYFARQDVIRLYGKDSPDQIKMFRLLVDVSLKLRRAPYAKLMLDEYRELLIILGPTPDPEYNRLKNDYETFVATEAEANLLAARKRAGVLQNLTTNPLTPGQVGYAITRQEQELLDKNFTLEVIDGPAGKKLKYGPHLVNDAALSLLSENGFLYKAVIGITLNSTNMNQETLHPALVEMTTLLFDPNHKSTLEWLLKTVNSADSTLAFQNTFTVDEKRIKVSRDKENNMVIVEFFPNKGT